MPAEDPLQAHRDASHPFEAAGVRSSVREQGDGEPVVCLHGVPTFSYLYRKVLPALAERGPRGIAFDFPGLGDAARPEEFDYSWTGLGRWTTAAVEALGLDRFHLLVHDVGGPVGFEVAARLPDRVASLTVLNAPIAVGRFVKPWTMRPFESKVLGPLWLKGMLPFLFVRLMYLQGVVDRGESPPEQLLPYLRVLRSRDGGRAFLQIMRSFETTRQKEALYREVLGHDRPTQVIWGELDPAIPFEDQGRAAEECTGTTATRLPAKHFLQEDHAPVIAAKVAELIEAG